MFPDDLLDYLEDEGVAFRHLRHPLAVDAQHLAEVLGIPGRQVAKAVFVKANDEPIICVLAAPDRLDLARLAHVLGDPDVRLMTEAEFAPWCPQCELGAVPPVGELLGLAMIFDAAIAENEWVVFRAGTHEDCVAMAYEDFEQLSVPMLVARIAAAPAEAARPAYSAG